MATHALKEALWLRTFISQVFAPRSSPTILFSDNQSTIALTQDHQYHARTRHIEVVEDGKVKLIYCPTNDMADETTSISQSETLRYQARTLPDLRKSVGESCRCLGKLAKLEVMPNQRLGQHNVGRRATNTGVILTMRPILYGSTVAHLRWIQ